MAITQRTLRREPKQRPANTALRNIHIRPILPDDWHRLQLFHRRLSQETVVRHFHAGKQELSEPLAHSFTQLDGHDEVGLVATTGTRGRIIGVARYVRLGPTSAEVAFVIEDASSVASSRSCRTSFPYRSLLPSCSLRL